MSLKCDGQIYTGPEFGYAACRSMEARPVTLNNVTRNLCLQCEVRYSTEQGKAMRDTLPDGTRVDVGRTRRTCSMGPNPHKKSDCIDPSKCCNPE